MKKSSKGGAGNMLLLASLGLGAFMLFKGKADAQSRPADVPAPSGEAEAEIPSAPSIVAVNKEATESPLPTAMVSDEEGMEAVTPGPDESQTQPRAVSNSGGGSTQAPGKSSVPPLVSTKLTQKEQTIINQGVLSDDLAVQRPDLYRAIYIRKHGKNGNGRKALQAANTAIQQIQKRRTTANSNLLAQLKRRKMAIRLNPNAGAMVTTAMNLGKRSTPGTGTQQTVLQAQKQIAPTSRKTKKVVHPTRKVAPTPTRRKPVTRKKR